MPQTVKVACCQLVPDVENPAQSVTRAREALAEAVAAGAQIVVLPELCASGYVFRRTDELRAAAQPASGELLAGWAQEVAKGDAIVIGGFAELAPDGRIFNSSALVDADGVKAVYRKIHLWNEESFWFARGDHQAPVVETRFGRIGLGVCYDIEFPELTRGLALGGAELLALPTNWPAGQWPPHEQTPILRSLALSTAYLSHVYVAVCDRAGNERDVQFLGASVITAPDGSVVAAVESGAQAQIIYADCDLRTARDKRTSARNDAFADRRPEYYAEALLSNPANR